MMKKYSLIGTFALLFLIQIGASGCEVITAVTDSDTYDVGETGVATITNGTNETAFLPGCSTFNFEKREAGSWVDRGPHVICVWEGIGVPLAPGASLSEEFTVPKEAGTWRLHYVVSFGCTEDVPLSEAECTSSDDVYTPPFEVLPKAEPTCEDLKGIDFGACEMVLGWGIVGGRCQMISGCSGDGIAFFSSEIDCLTECVDNCDLWYSAYTDEVSRITVCDDASECEEVRGTSCGCTRNLVANKNIDRTNFEKLLEAMGDAGCGMATVCDCPPADGFICRNNRCAWNYL